MSMNMRAEEQVIHMHMVLAIVNVTNTYMHTCKQEKACMQMQCFFGHEAYNVETERLCSRLHTCT